MQAELVSELISSDVYPRRYLKFDHTVPAPRRRRQHYTTSGVLGWGDGLFEGEVGLAASAGRTHRSGVTERSTHRRV